MPEKTPGDRRHDKSTMAHAGFPRSLLPEAMRNTVYVKTRVYNKSTQGIPCEMMFGAKPHIHHIRTFGAIAYAHIPASPGRKKNDISVKTGFVLGYAEDVVWCKVYFLMNKPPNLSRPYVLPGASSIAIDMLQEWKRMIFHRFTLIMMIENKV